MGNQNRLYIILLIVGVFLGAATVLLLPKLKGDKALKADSLTIETVSRGKVISALKTTGVVQSESEILLVCPTRSSIKTIFKDPGSRVEKGELILQLDDRNTNDEIDRLTAQLEMKRISLEKNNLGAESIRLDLANNKEAKENRLNSLKATLLQQQKLLTTGETSSESIERIKHEIELSEQNIQNISEKNDLRLKQLAADKKGLEIQVKAQEKIVKGKQELLKQLKITAPSSGIILDVGANEGERVDVERILVRMSDLSVFKVVGEKSQEFGERIKTGNPAIVKIDDVEIQGHVGNTYQMDENSKIEFDIHLIEKSHPKLKVNQIVEIQIINKKVENVLRIKKSSNFDDNKNQTLFVVTDNEAVKTAVALGTIGDDFCEIVSGLKEGDKIITSGIPDEELDRIRIRN
jgi:HlyD family secretion protein